MMEKHLSNKGFTLVEMCIVMLSLSTLALICLPAHEFSQGEWYLFPSKYWKKQSDSILNGEDNQIESEDGHIIYFNQKGNVRQAKTLQIGNRKLVVELGGGRLLEKEE